MMDAPQQLKATLERVQASILSECPRADFFANPVSTAQVPDYHSFVDPAQEVTLDMVSERIAQNYYTSIDQYRADLEAIHRNAVAYNTKGAGKHAYAPIILWARELLDIMERELKPAGQVRLALHARAAFCFWMCANVGLCECTARPPILLG